MPGRGHSTYNKRQKEISRQEKRREKAARKQQRKLEKQSGFSASSGDSITAESPGTAPGSYGESVADADVSPKESN